MVKIIHCSGKRKSAVARATIKPGKGKVRINKKMIDTIQPKIAQLKMKEPLILAGNIAETIDVEVNVNGGGITSQSEAVRLAIARSLVKFNKKLEKNFLNYDRQLLVADVRRKEPHKPNTSKGARSKRQKSYR